MADAPKAAETWAEDWILGADTEPTNTSTIALQGRELAPGEHVQVVDKAEAERKTAAIAAKAERELEEERQWRRAGSAMVADEEARIRQEVREQLLSDEVCAQIAPAFGMRPYQIEQIVNAAIDAALNHAFNKENNGV